MTLRCLLVDDNGHFLAAARALLEGEGVDVVGAVSTTAEARRDADELRPDVVLVDIGLRGESGFDLARDLAERCRPTPVILVSTHDGDDYAELLAASPAIGFVPKTALSAGALRNLLARNDPGAPATPVSGPPGTQPPGRLTEPPGEVSALRGR